MKIAFVTDGGLKMGMGHIYRAISLGEELEKIGEIHFFTKSDKIVVNKIKNHGFTVFKLKSDNEIIRKLKDIRPIVVVIDKLTLKENFVRSLKRNSKTRIVIFDNLSPANEYADVVVNAIAEGYSKNRKYVDKSTNTFYFYGPKYLLLREEFYEHKKNTEKELNEIGRVLLIFGGSDPSNLSSKTLDKILCSDRESKVSVVLGPHFEYFKELNEILKKHEDKKEVLKIYKDVKNVAELMCMSDLVITSPGLSMFEALFVGTPVIAVCQNQLQKNVYRIFFSKVGEKNARTVPDLFDTFFLINPKDDHVKRLNIAKGKREVIEAVKNIAIARYFMT
jgi:UDP-2,4-diacetamido-2,4,6-trideoxy-beta-L-altropyranose hydrolase